MVSKRSLEPGDRPCSDRQELVSERNARASEIRRQLGHPNSPRRGLLPSGLLWFTMFTMFTMVLYGLFMDNDGFTMV